MQKLINTHSFMFRATAAGLALAVLLFGFVFSLQTAKADVNPAACLANDFSTQLNKSVAVAYDETNPSGATTITYSVEAGNPQNISSNGCNVDGVTVTLTTPDGVAHTLQTGGSYPVGTALAQVGASVSYIAHSTDIAAGKLTASATATGQLHDTPSGTDPMNSGKTVSVTVIHPNTTVTITPSVATTSAGGTVNLTITEHNSGDSSLASTSVTLTPPGTTLNASSTSFTGGDTGSDGVLGVGETWTWVVPTIVSANTTYTAVGTGTDSLGHSVTSPTYPTEQASTTVHVLNTPTIATTLSTTTTNTSTAVHDSAVLSGATSGAGGTVLYTAYTDNACTVGAQSAGTKTVASGVVPNSDPLTFAVAGTYYWQVAYSGDANNAPATSTCGTETVVVNSFTASMTTAIHQGATDSGTPVVVTSISAGGTVHDSATLAFGGPTPTGTVDFTFFDTAGNCDSHSVAAGSVAINGSGVADPSSAEGPLAVGNYAFRAHWAGDANHPAGATSACELLAVTQQQPTISTKLSQTSTTTGVAVHDSATLSGTTATAGGMATYMVYTDNQCSVGAQAAGTVSVTNGTVPDSNPITFNTAGTYYWQVVYSGDAGNKAATSTCSSEVLTIGQFAPSISTTLSTTNTSTSTPVHDSATLSGASSDAGGTAVYSVFTDASCSLGMMSAGVKTVAAGVIPDSDALTFATPGTYYWQVAYSGDVKNAAATSSCSREVLTVAAPPPPPGICPADWKPVGNGWMNFGPIVYMNQGGNMFNPNNPCPPTLPLQFSPTNPNPTSTPPVGTPPPTTTRPTRPSR